MMEEFNIQGKQTSFYKYCPGTFGYILVRLPLSLLTSQGKVLSHCLSSKLFKRVRNVVARNGGVWFSEGCKVCSNAELLLGRNWHLVSCTYFAVSLHLGGPNVLGKVFLDGK